MNCLPAAALACATLATSAFTTAQAAQASSDGLHVGYYQEDPATNPEDPTMGSVFLSLPGGDSSFSGSMFFTFVGCQHESLGAVAGTKAGEALKGTWSGAVDDTQQKGAFEGAWSATLGGYAGAYTVAGGKQHVAIADCIDYFIAPRGTWELLPVGTSVPASFAIAVDGTMLHWTPPPGVAMTLVYVLDPALAKAGAPHAAAWQTLLFGAGKRAADLRLAHMKPGHTYVVAVSMADGSAKHVGFASKAVVAP